MDASLKAVLGADVQGFVSGMQAANSSTNSFNKSLQDLNQTFIVENNALNLSSGFLKQQAQAAQVATTANSSLAVAAKETSASFDGFGAKISQQRVALVDLGRIATGTGFTVRSLGSQLALFSLPVVAAVAAIGFLISKLHDSDSQVSKTSEALDAYNKLLAQIAENNTKEASTVDILVQKLQSGTLSRQDTVTAIKELQKIAPDYFGKLNTEKASIEDITKAYGNYNNALVSSIENQIKIAELNDLVKQRLTQSAQTPEAASFIAGLQAQGKTLDQINQIAAKGIQEEIHGEAEILQTSKFISDEKLKQQLLDSKVPAGVQTILALLQKEQDIIKGITNVSNLVKLDKVDIPDVQDPQKSVIRFGMDLNLDNTDALQDKIKTVVGKLDKFAFLKLQFNTEALAPSLDKLNKSLTEIVSNFEGDLITKTAEAIGTAIGSGGNVLKSAGKAIIDEIGDALKALGEAMVKYATYQEIAISLSSLSPAVGLAAGIAAEIAGTALIESSGSHAFADGGIVTGPVNALIGEAGPEVIFPLNQLERFFKVNQPQAPVMEVQVKGQLKGTDIMISGQRTARSQGRVS